MGVSAEGATWVACDFGSTAREVFIGHPFVCDRPEVSITVAQTGPESFQIEAPHPTDLAIQTTLAANADAGMKVATQQIHLSAGNSEVIVVESR